MIKAKPSHYLPIRLAGQPCKTAELVRYIQDNLYSGKRDSLSRNEDAGKMAALYNFCPKFLSCHSRKRIIFF